jgi:hypothetical protein
VFAKFDIGNARQSLIKAHADVTRGACEDAEEDQGEDERACQEGVQAELKEELEIPNADTICSSPHKRQQQSEQQP